jgi:hypothetical protein
MSFIEAETTEMNEGRYSKPESRILLGIMNQFGYLAEAYRASWGEEDLVTLALRLSETPCGPLYKRHVSLTASSTPRSQNGTSDRLMHDRDRESRPEA